MTSHPSKTRRVATLALAGLLLASIAGTTQAGVIANMIAKRRAERQSRAQATTQGEPMIRESKAISVADHGSSLLKQYGLPDPGNAGSISLAGRFKRRFPIRGGGRSKATSTSTSDVFSSDRDSGVFKTSR